MLFWNLTLLEEEFRITFKADGTSVNTSSDTIDFETRHNFELGEGVVYDARGNTPVGNIVSGATYYAFPVSDLIIKLHTTPEDAIAGINTVNLGSVSLVSID